MKTEKYCTSLEIDGAAPCFRKMVLETADIENGYVATIGTKGFLSGFETDAVVTTTNIDDAIIFKRIGDASRAGRGFNNGTFNLVDGMKIVKGWVQV
jgi:hypothetical protein